MSLIENTKSRTARVREALAGDMFGWESVVLLIGEAASGGWERVVLKPKLAVDLSQTKAAKDLVAKLTAHGFGVRWLRVRITQDEPEIPILEICWPLAALSLPQ